MSNLNQLRKNDIDWNKAEASLHNVLKSMNPVDALQVALTVVERHLDYYIQNNPDLVWVKDYLTLANALKPIDYEEKGILTYHHLYSDDLSVGFMMGFSLIDSYYRRTVDGRTESHDYTSMLSDGISTILGSRLQSFRMKNFPDSMISMEEESELLEPDDFEKALRRVNRYKYSQERKDFINLLWREVADTISSFIEK